MHKTALEPSFGFLLLACLILSTNVNTDARPAPINQLT